MRTHLWGWALALLMLASPLTAQPSRDSLAILKQARRDVAALCSEMLAGRGYARDGHLTAARWIERRMRSIRGLEVSTQPFTAEGTLMMRVDSTWVPSPVSARPAQNVIGVLRGHTRPDSAIIICAHYDHLGEIERGGRPVLFPGANDNAAGVALLLHLAKRAAQSPERFPYTLVFIAFAAEEIGLRGSMHYASHPTPLPLAQVAMVWNLDLVGFGEKGLVVVNGMTAQRDTLPLARHLLAVNERHGFFERVELRPNRPNSDHWPLTQAGVPGAFLFTEGGPGHYHDRHDRPETLTLCRFVNLARLIEHTLWLSIGRPRLVP